MFISTLGAGFYSEGIYCSIESDFVSSRTRFIQQATAEFLAIDKWTDKDVAVFLLTDKARKDNWSVLTRKDKNDKDVAYEGLERILKQMSLPVSIRDLSIPDGKNEEEIWKIFSILYEEIQDGDELYFDVTHGFRNLPMLVLVLGNYSKFLKNTVIRSITYGSFENRDSVTGYAPIIDMLPLSVLQDWTFSAADYIKNGNVESLKDVCMSAITPVLAYTKGADENASALRGFANTLEIYTDEVKSCRGMDIYSKQTVGNLCSLMKGMGKTFVTPMNPIIAKVRESFEPYAESDGLQNLFLSAEWCFNKGLYQSAVTILQEAIVSGICLRTGIGDFNDNEIRSQVASAIKYAELKNKGEEDKFNGPLPSCITDILADRFFSREENISRYIGLSALRNDINHSGMRAQPSSPKGLKTGIAGMFEYFRPLFDL